AVNFLFKYAVTCSVRLRMLFSRSSFIIGLFTLGALWIGIFLGTNMVYGVPNQTFIDKTAKALNIRFATDFRQVYFGGVDSSTLQGGQSIGMLLATINYLSIIFSCIGTMLWCGWRINRRLKSKNMTE
ncbi:hypothetical protein PFISCL1PPCAC_11516, partial [Pristionchus fissidentatus]